jgi:hypothetical protein
MNNSLIQSWLKLIAGEGVVIALLTAVSIITRDSVSPLIGLLQYALGWSVLFALCCIGCLVSEINRRA